MSLGALVACSSLMTSSVACDQFQPETGERRALCVDADSNPAATVDFKRDLRPLISGEVPGTKGCKSCHFPGVGTQEGFLETGLNLSKLQDLRKGGQNTGTGVVIPGKPCSSAIVKKLQGTFGGARMPKGGPYWDASKIQIMIDWIAEGAQGGDE
jgi:hypothetical protein